MEGTRHAPCVGLAIPVDEKRPPRQGKDAVPTRGHAMRVVTGASLRWPLATRQPSALSRPGSVLHKGAAAH